MKARNNIENLLHHAIRALNQPNLYCSDTYPHYFQFGSHKALLHTTLPDFKNPNTWPKILSAESMLAMGCHAIPHLNLSCYTYDTKQHVFIKNPSTKLYDVLYDEQHCPVLPKNLPKIMMQAVLLCELFIQQDWPRHLLNIENTYLDQEGRVFLVTFGEQPTTNISESADPIKNFLLDVCGWHTLRQQHTQNITQANTTFQLVDHAQALDLPYGHIPYTELVLDALTHQTHFAAMLTQHAAWPMLHMPPKALIEEIKTNLWPTHRTWETLDLSYPHMTFVPKDATHQRHLLTLLCHMQQKWHTMQPIDALLQEIDFPMQHGKTDPVKLHQKLTTHGQHLPTQSKHHLDMAIDILEKQTILNRLDAANNNSIAKILMQLSQQHTQHFLEFSNHFAILKALFAETDHASNKDTQLSAILTQLNTAITAELTQLVETLKEQHQHHLTQDYMSDTSLQQQQIQSILQGPTHTSCMTILATLQGKKTLPKPHPAVMALYQQACQETSSGAQLIHHTHCALQWDASLDLLDHGPKIYALYLQALDYGQKMAAANPTQPKHQLACKHIRDALQHLHQLKEKETQQRQRRTSAHLSWRKKRWLPMLLMGGGALTLSFGLTGAMFALPMEELMLFNTFMVGEEILVALLSGGTGIVGLCTLRKQDNHQTSTPQKTSRHASDQKLKRNTAQSQQQALIGGITQCLRDLKSTSSTIA